MLLEGDNNGKKKQTVYASSGHTIRQKPCRFRVNREGNEIDPLESQSKPK